MRESRSERKKEGMEVFVNRKKEKKRKRKRVMRNVKR